MRVDDVSSIADTTPHHGDNATVFCRFPLYGARCSRVNTIDRWGEIPIESFTGPPVARHELTGRR